MKEEEKKTNSFKRLSSAGIQMGIIIGGAAWGGTLLDEKYNNEKPIWTIVCALAGVGAGLYLMIREVIRISKNENDGD